MNSGHELKLKVLKSTFWKGMERILAQAVSAIVSIILARILMPEDYSIVSIATIFFAFCNLFISNGINSSLIQKKDSDALDYSTVFTTNMAFAALLYIVMFFAAPYIAELYRKDSVILVIRVMALTFFINGYKAVLTAKISSDLEFKKFFFSTIIGTIVSSAVGIIMALKGYGAWALVAQQMSNSLIDSVVLKITTKIKFGLRFSYQRFKRLFSYGGKIFLASILTTIYAECRPLIIGIRFNVEDLAFYNKASTFPGLVNSIGNNTLLSTLFPAMSKVQDDKSIVLNMTRRFMKLSSFVVFPLTLGMLAVSENLVRVLLTEKWLPCVPYMMIFCFTYTFEFLQNGNLQSIKAIGRSDIILKTEIIKKTSYFIIIVLFVYCSSTPLQFALSNLVIFLVATAVNTYPNRRLLGYSYKMQVLDILPNLFPAAVMCIAVYLMNRLNMNSIVLLIMQILSGGMLYVLLCIIMKNENLEYIKLNYHMLIRRKKG